VSTLRVLVLSVLLCGLAGCDDAPHPLDAQAIQIVVRDQRQTSTYKANYLPNVVPRLTSGIYPLHESPRRVTQIGLNAGTPYPNIDQERS
jgi:hypothetical protein